MTVTRLPRPVHESYEWQEQGLCRGADVEQFFADDPDLGQVARRERTDAAKAVCASCPVARQCLDHAMRVPEPFGIWGGTTAAERSRLLWDAAG
jgi:WhiB family redox-sensing transcriptional regulator